VKDMPMLEAFLPQTMFVLLRFNKWDEVLAEKAPPPEQRVTTVVWHYGRALAYAGKGDIENAERSQHAFATAAASVPRDTMLGVLNTAGGVFDIASAVVDARIATARGDQARAVERWKAAVQAQDALHYDEPPAWYYPVRESLGAALLGSGRAAEAAEVFRKDLELNPGNGRSLFGLSRALAAQGKNAEAAKVRQQFEAAWKTADVQLTIEKL
jgi:tetratricopeptide (TPR) repeat protein